MKTASILTVSLIFVAFNGVACLESKREKAIKDLREYIEEVQICGEHDPKGAKFQKMLHDFRIKGVFPSTCGRSSGPSLSRYHILWIHVFDKNPLRLAERVLKDLSLRTAIDELKKEYLDKHKKPDKMALFELLGDFTKKELMSEEKVNYYKEQLEEGSYSDANELAKQVLKDLRFHKGIEELKDFQIEYRLRMKSELGLYGLLQKYKTQKLISLNIFKEYEKKLRAGEDVARIACAALTHLITELNKSEGLFYRETAIKKLEAYIEEALPNRRFDRHRHELFGMLRKFHKEDVISKQQIDSYEVKKTSVWYDPVDKLVQKVIRDIHLQMAIDELKKYLVIWHQKPDEVELFRLLRDYKRKELITKEKFNKYQKLLADGTCSDANKLAEKVLTDLKTQKAINELDEFKDNYTNKYKEPEEKPDRKELFDLFDKIRRQKLMCGTNYDKYVEMLDGNSYYTVNVLKGNLAMVACAAIRDLTPNRDPDTQTSEACYIPRRQCKFNRR